MAYVSQELKAQLSPQIRAILKKYGVKGSIAVRNHRTLEVNIQQGPIDFISDFNKTCADTYPDFRPTAGSINVNTYHYKNHFTGKALKFLTELLAAMNQGNYDHSDLQSDYFCVGWYVDVNIGRWNKPYALAG